ncbi:NAD(P)/FAD-dependent oxidoreductase [Pseudanabaena sp. ABRG5-3]|uniref:NAD(P)/FAD-dependent oxidoreductase n=1 Tax=Pseudanabaena sp. ABRG5-3 TaxID=685565 RepID=UPI000DC71444|nr:FAD-dependent oxidoreductase [Pseudanabaena sp. ABRG5-3]BBC23158.1 D-amino acid dehydrogenase small subunit [Pseudanabaena sp. ABRG5-3]
MTTITIVGCGVIGALLAYELSKDVSANALDVTVLETNAQPAMGATGASLGVLMAVCSAKARGVLVKLRLASLSKYDRLIMELTTQTKQDLRYNRNGILNLSRSPNAETTARSLIEIRRKQGFELQWLEHQELNEQFSQWQAEGGLFSPCDRAVHPTRFVNALVAAATQNGVKFLWNTSVKNLEDISSDRIVITSGMGSNPLIAPFLKNQTQDLLLPIGGQALRLKVPNLNLKTIVHAENENGSDINIVPLGDDQYWLGATLEFEPSELPREANVPFLLEQAIAWCPTFANAEVLETWAGDRPRPQANQSPILGFVPDHPHMLIATGHYRNGVMMAPVTAQITKDLLLTGESDLPWRPFALKSFQ